MWTRSVSAAGLRIVATTFQPLLAKSLAAELLGRVTAINSKNLSGSERCSGGTKPDYDTGDLFRLADAADGSRGFYHLLYFRRSRHEVAIHSCLDRPGRDGIDSNVLWGIFQRDRFGYPVDGVLAGNVDRNLGHADQSRDRRVVDDGTAAGFQHRRNLVL